MMMSLHLFVTCLVVIVSFGTVTNDVPDGKEIKESSNDLKVMSYGQSNDLEIKYLRAEIEKVKLTLQMSNLKRDMDCVERRHELEKLQYVISNQHAIIEQLEKKVTTLFHQQCDQMHDTMKNELIDLFVKNVHFIPTGNVALLKKGAKADCITGDTANHPVSLDAVIDGNSDFAQSKVYTVCQIDHPKDVLLGRHTNQLVIQLGQQYILSSMKLRLLEFYNRAYQFFIEVSTDRISWTRVYDATDQWQSGWVNVTFTPQFVKFIKIVPTNSKWTAHPVPPRFDIVHLETPAQE